MSQDGTETVECEKGRTAASGKEEFDLLGGRRWEWWRWNWLWNREGWLLWQRSAGAGTRRKRSGEPYEFFRRSDWNLRCRDGRMRWRIRGCRSVVQYKAWISLFGGASLRQYHDNSHVQGDARGTTSFPSSVQSGQQHERSHSVKSRDRRITFSLHSTNPVFWRF